MRPIFEEMSEKSKLSFALIEVDILFKLFKTNDSKKMFYSNLIKIEEEIHRQLSEYDQRTN